MKIEVNREEKRIVIDASDYTDWEFNTLLWDLEQEQRYHESFLHFRNTAKEMGVCDNE